LRAAVESAGLTIGQWNDLSEQAATLMDAFLSLPPSPLGLHAFVEDFTEKARNLTRGLSGGRLRAIQAIAQAAA
jgi:sarcosine/dimethylglycine N-methyltransferase